MPTQLTAWLVFRIGLIDGAPRTSVRRFDKKALRAPFASKPAGPKR